jgi:gliding motility-associated-like protein
MKRKFDLLLFLSVACFMAMGTALSAQNITLQLSSSINRICNGIDCNYNGPSILINEVMLSPLSGDGSIYGSASGMTTQGEWIELYNPDECNSVDISCYFLGNNTNDGGFDYGAGFIIPQNTIVPPQGFCVIRGILAPPVPSHLLVANGGKTIEIVLNASQSSRICLGGGTRLWFPNAGGWFAFYDKNGVPQDAISWNSTTNSCMSCFPCNPGPLGACNFSGTLASYTTIPASRKTYILSAAPAQGLTYRRIPDGGNWVVDQAASSTMGNCNTICNPPPIITCNGSATVFASGGIPPYTYKWNDVMNQTTQTAIGLCEGTYCVTVTDVQNQTTTGCIQLKNLSLQVNAVANSLVCQNGNIQFNVSSVPSYANDTITWTGPGGFTSNGTVVIIPNATPSMNGQYIVTVADSNQCFGKDTLQITVHPQPVITISPFSAVICKGDTINLTASGGISYSWSSNLSNGAMQNVAPVATVTYTVTGTDVIGCTATAQSQVEVIDLSVQIDPFNPAVCYGDQIQLTATSNGNNISYLWNNGNTNASFTVSPQATTAFSVEVTDLNGCRDSATVIVNVKPIPAVDFSASPLEGCIPLGVSFVNLSEAGNAQWLFGDGASSTLPNPLHHYINSGYFDVSLTVNADGCDSTLIKPQFIYVYPKPYAGFIPSENAVSEDDPYVSFTDLSQGAVSWFWDFGTGNPIDVSDLQNPDFTYPAVGTYTVWQFVKNDLNCSDSAKKRIIVKPLETLYFPNAFTPNGDGLNEVFIPFGNGTEPDDYELLIYDRWGELVFATTNINIPWTGEHMKKPGKILPTGVYVYIAKVGFSEKIKIFKGIVTLIY